MEGNEVTDLGEGRGRRLVFMFFSCFGEVVMLFIKVP